MEPNQQTPSRDGQGTRISATALTPQERYWRADYPRTDASKVRQIGGVVFIATCTVMAWAGAFLPFPPMGWLALGTGVGLVLFAPGVFLSGRGLAPGKALLGAGMAFLFFTAVTALFFLFPRHYLLGIPSHPVAGIFLSMLLLMIFGMMAHRAASQSVSLLVLVLCLYLVRIISLLVSVETLPVFLVLSSILIALYTCIWLRTRPGRLFPAAAVAVLYGVYFVVPHGHDLGPVLFMVLAGGLTLNYAALSVCIVMRIRRTAGAEPLIVVLNTLLFAAAGIWIALPDWPPFLYILPALVALVAMASAFVLSKEGGREKPSGLFVVLAAVALVIAVASPLASGARPAIIAAACLGPALLGRRRADGLFRFVEYACIGVALTATFWIESTHENVQFAFVSMPLNWVMLLACVALFLFMARIHTGWIHERGVPGRGACMPYGVEQEQLALAHACAAALLVTLHTVLRRGDSEFLPILLTTEALLFSGVAMVLMAPVIALAGLLPAVAGYVCYFLFPYVAGEGLARSSGPGNWELLFVFALIFSLAIYHDHWLHGRSRPRAAGLDRFASTLPYLVSAALVFQMARDGMLTAWWPAPITLVAALLLYVSSRYGLLGLGVIACGLLALAVCYWPVMLLGPWAQPDRFSWYLPLLALQGIGLALFERIVIRFSPSDARREAIVGHVFAVLMACVGVMGLYCWNGGVPYVLALGMLALFMMLTGLATGVRAYFHCAIIPMVIMGLFLIHLTGWASSGGALPTLAGFKTGAWLPQFIGL